MPRGYRRPGGLHTIAEGIQEGLEDVGEARWNSLISNFFGNSLNLSTPPPQQYEELYFGGSYPVSSISTFGSLESQDVTAISEDVFNDFWLLRTDSKSLNDVKTNVFYEPLVEYIQHKDNNLDYDSMTSEEATDMFEYVQDLVANEMYGNSIANLSEASPYSNEIIESFTSRAGVTDSRDPSLDIDKVNYTVMPGGRRTSVCADTACAVFTGAGMVNYLPWDKNASKWASSNDYIIDAFAGRIKGDDSYKHWNIVSTGNLNNLKNVQPGDWVIYGDGDAWLPQGHPDRSGVEGNESGKHSMIVLDVTEKGILFGSGNATAAPYEHNRDEQGREPLNPRGINTRFLTWEEINYKSEDGYQGNAYRFNPQSDKFAFFKGEVFSHKSDAESYELESGDTDRRFRY